MADIFVSDAFGSVHRAHASTVGVADYLPAVSGLLVEKELEVMGKALDDPKRPFVAVLGGAKVSDKIGVINNLLEKADTIIIGGGMAYTFIRPGRQNRQEPAGGGQAGLRQGDDRKGQGQGRHVPAAGGHAGGGGIFRKRQPRHRSRGNIPTTMMGMDIGPKTVETLHLRRRARAPWSGTAPWASLSSPPSPAAPRPWPRRWRSPAP
jgi:hypothetical protein